MDKNKELLINYIEAYAAAKKSDNFLLINFATDLLNKHIIKIFSEENSNAVE